jgi:phenylpropionate dioxygenase-like ring-hydroxylating dioxygenase large terminal subunit
VVLYRFTPRGLRETDCEITWLVNEDAREGLDYDLAKLTWLWDVTTIADKTIIERNQAGVDSRFYEPGPLSPMEDFMHRFLQWYVATMQDTAHGVRDRGVDDPPTASSRGLPPLVVEGSIQRKSGGSSNG